MKINISGGVLDFEITDEQGKTTVQKFNIALTPIVEVKEPVKIPPVVTPPVVVKPEVSKGLVNQAWTTEYHTSKIAFNKDKNRGFKIAYKLLLPKGYDKDDKTKKWPVIIYLGGDGIKNHHATEDYKNIDADMNKEEGLAFRINRGLQVPAIVICPYIGWEFGGYTMVPTKDGEQSHPGILIDEFLYYVLTNLNADPNKVHLMGASKGGYGAAEAMHKSPGKYASVIIFSASQDVNGKLIKSAVRVLKGIPDTQGGGNPAVDVEFIKNMKANKLSPDAEFSLLKTGHDTWKRGTDKENQFKAVDLVNGYPGNYVPEVDLIEWALSYQYVGGKVVKIK